MEKLYTLNELILIYGIEDKQVKELLKVSVYSENRSIIAFKRM